MKTSRISLLIAATLVATAGSSAFANDKWLGDRGDNWESHIVSTQSRTQVIAELNDARAQGLTGYAQDTNYPQTAAFKATRTRAEVSAEAVSAAKDQKRPIEYVGG